MNAAEGIAVALVVSILFGAGCWGYPQYRVYSERMSGEAELARAEYAKKVLVQDAIARQESAGKLSEAEVIRAEGVAKANRIIGDSLRENEAYLRYMWIRSLEEGKNEIIYIPTEAGMPILEAGKREKAK